MGDEIHFKNARILTLAGGTRLRRGKQMSELGVIPRGELLVAGGKVAAVGEKVEAPPGSEVIDAAGRVLMPGFVDCHTHACFVASRLDDWTERLRGQTETEIGAKGGGAPAIMRAVQEATLKQLAAALRERLARLLRDGTTTVEVKSGYGLTGEAELKMLRAVVRAGKDWPGTVVPTALIGHARAGRADEDTVTAARGLLHEVSQEFPGIAVDVQADEAAWTRETCVRLLEKAAKHHPLRVHADESKPLGLLPEAIRLHARSADHLETSTKADLIALGGSDVCGVIAPGVGFHTTGRYARGGFLIDQGGAVALASHLSPDLCPIHSLPMAMALAVRFCGLSAAEAIAAATVNAAAVLGLTDRGTLEPGQRADLLLLAHADERQLAYEPGGASIDRVFCAGRPVGA